MKTVSLLATLLLCATQLLGNEWFQLEKETRAVAFDGYDIRIGFHAKEVFPVARILKAEEVDTAAKRFLPKAAAYFVIPLPNGFHAVTPIQDGKWIDGNDAKFS